MKRLLAATLLLSCHSTAFEPQSTSSVGIGSEPRTVDSIRNAFAATGSSETVGIKCATENFFVDATWEKDNGAVLHAARMLDVHSGKLVQNAWLLVEGSKIKSIGTSPPAGAHLITELGDVTLIPGLIDCHVHLSGALEGDFVNRPVHESAVDDAIHAVANAKKTVEAGFTTVRNVGCGDFVDVALMRAVERGEIVGPWIWPAGYSVGITGGHADETGFRPGLLTRGPDEGIADGPDECRKAVRAQLKYGAKVIKCVATAGVLSFEESVGAQQLSDDELAAIVEEASRHGVKVCAHAHGTQGILAAVKAGVASIEHGSMIDEACIAEMKKRGTYLVPTSYLATGIDLDNLPPQLRAKAESILPVARKNLSAAIAAGVKIAFGTDAAVIPHGHNAREFAVYVECGMSPLDAIRTATIHAADLLGVKDRGEIKEGMLADLVAVPGNPLEDITALERPTFVMHGGQRVR